MGAEALVKALAARQLRVAFAESCTGGGCAHALSSIAGASAVFELGLVTYSNRMKSQLLGVSPSLLAQHGAVSRPCVEAMVAGLEALCGAALGAAVSGIAGPGGGSADKPVGTVWIALRGDGQTHSRQFLFEGPRQAVRRASVEAVFAGLRNITEGKAPW